MTHEDLRSYRAVIREPIDLPYRGLTVQIAPPPSAGGVAVAQMLTALQHLEAFRLTPQSAEEIHLFVEVARRAHATRRFHVVDPDSVPGYDLRAERTRWLDAAAFLRNAPPIDPNRATPSSAVHELYPAAMKELENTTHFSVIDGEGNAVTCTTTLSAGFGAKIVAPGTGIVLNNSVAAFGTTGRDVLAPGRRMTSSMSPTLVLNRGEPVLLLGSPGGDTIPNTVVQILRNLVDHGMALDAAIDAPRIHHGFVPDEIRIEGERPLPEAIRHRLAAKGHRFAARRTTIGDANNILVDGGIAWGYADPREGGLALGPRPPDSRLQARSSPP